MTVQNREILWEVWLSYIKNSLGNRRYERKPKREDLVQNLSITKTVYPTILSFPSFLLLSLRFLIFSYSDLLLSPVS